MAEITSAMVAKYLRKLNEEHDALLQKEKKSDIYTVSVQWSADQPEEKICPWAEEVRLQSVHFIVYDSGYTVVWLDQKIEKTGELRL